MNIDVFISYSSLYKNLVDALVHYLEGNKIKCWYAPRDISPGMEYAEAIDEAIKNSTISIVLVSESSQNSQWCRSEMNLSVSYGKIIIPVRIEDVELHGSMKLYLNNRHWIEAFPNPESNFGNIRKAIERFIIPEPRNDNLSRDVCKVRCAEIPVQTFTGAVVQPECDLFDDELKYALVKGKDYVVAFEDADSPGSATLIITGIGSYCGEKRVCYKIKKGLKDIRDCELILNKKIDSYSFSVKPDYILSYGKSQLLKGRDFKEKIRTVDSLGKGAIDILGIGKYCGRKILYYEIKRRGWFIRWVRFWARADVLGFFALTVNILGTGYVVNNYLDFMSDNLKATCCILGWMPSAVTFIAVLLLNTDDKIVFSTEKANGH